MKILLCTWRLTHGGAERVAALWAQGFANQGHSVDILVGSHSSPIEYNIPKTTNIYYETPFPDKIAVRFCPQFYKNYRIKKILVKSKPNIIISILPAYGEKIKKILKNDNIPIIVTEHNSYERPDYAPMPQIQVRQKFKTNRIFDAVTVLTQADKAYLIRKMGSDFAKNTHVLPNPLTFVPNRNELFKKKIILASGRMEVWHCKGLDLLVEAWSQIATKHEDWALHIAGDGNTTHIHSIVQKLNIENRVKFLGFVNMQECYKEASIFVLSSRYEGFGMVLTEAMSQGCACIACDYKGRQREIIENDTQGIICPVDDVNALANAMEKMITDESYRNTCQKNAVERSKFYALPNIMKKWDDILKKMNLEKQE